ncbi:MAG: cysteine desulfurase family protein [Candidatus Micrarchaeota archaeon]
MRVYLDHAATTPVDPRVLAEMKPFFSQKFGNASSLHSFGREAKEALELARERVAKLIAASPDEIIFTSGGTEADNLAVLGGFDAARGNKVVCSAIEHPAVLEPCNELGRRGAERTLLPVNSEGIVELSAARKLVSGASLVSVMHANNEVGSIQPVVELARVARDAGALFHCDAVQSAGKIPADIKKLGVDLLTLSSHKIYGPKGVGALFVRRGAKIKPIVFGGGHERALRSGTENIAGIVGFGKACELALRELPRESKRLAALRDRLLKKLLEMEGAFLNGSKGARRLPNNINVSFEAIEGEGILLGLDDFGIAVSTGSACSSKKLQPSHVLLAMGRRPEQAHGSVRFTLGRGTTAKQVDFAAARAVDVVERLRAMSPFKPGQDLSAVDFGGHEEEVL